jgi:hypothetical protein
MVHGCGRFIQVRRSRLGDVVSAAMAGSMPAWTPHRSSPVAKVFVCVPDHRGGQRGQRRSADGRDERHHVSRQTEPDRSQNGCRASSGHHTGFSSAPHRIKAPPGSLSPTHVSTLPIQGTSRGRARSAPVRDTFGLCPPNSTRRSTIRDGSEISSEGPLVPENLTHHIGGPWGTQ